MSTIASRFSMLFSYSFRPLFLLLVLHSFATIAFWTLWWTGNIQVEWVRNPILWHGHEMLAGFAGAAIGGFLLTAAANWTGRAPVSGVPLMVLCGLWLGGRLSVFNASSSAIFDIAYWLMLWLLAANEIFRAGNRRNYKILAVLGLVALSDALYHVMELHHPALQRNLLWAQLWLIVVLITVIGGRIIPAFTGNWLRTGHADEASPPVLPPAFGMLDLLAIIVLLLFAVCTLVPSPPLLAMAIGLTAAALHAWRLARWQGHRTLRDPLVWMLHLSYAWIPVGVALMALASGGYLPASVGIHALTVGAVAGMIVSVSSRAALGHTNRPLHAHPLLTSCIVLLNVTACLRIAAALSGHMALVGFSGMSWAAAFLCFGICYVPILLGPSVGK